MTYLKSNSTIKKELDYVQLYNRALNYLSRREYSRVELERKLQTLSDNQEIISNVLDELAHKNLQSDERFVEMTINSKSSKYGSLRISDTLRQKGIDSDTIQNNLPDKNSEITNALSVLYKKFGDAPEYIPTGDDDYKHKHRISFSG